MLQKMKTVASHALGCKVNQYESEAIAELFAEKGYEVVNVEQKADIYVINTCTVTNFGDKKSRQLIRKVKRQNPNSIVAVIGCYAQTASQEISNIEEVNLIIGTKDRKNIVELVESYKKEQGVVNFVTEISKERKFEPLSVQKLAGRTRAYLKIQDGCSQFCSYCIIPYARGPIRSRDPQEVLKEVNILAENGFLELVLTGIHVASYGKDLKTIDLLGILKKVHAVEKIKRIRFSSIEPNSITKQFMEEVSKLSKVCNHFHLSLQSGCDKTLQAMNRKYTTEQYRQAVHLIKQYMPQAAITTDMIVGFPAESQEDFEKSFLFAKEMQFAKIHVFPFSPKKGTPAASMKEQIPNNIKAQRSKKLIELSNEMTKDFLSSHIGQKMDILFERKLEKNIFEGHTTNYIKVHVKSDEDLKNKICCVKLLQAEQENMTGVIEQ